MIMDRESHWTWTDVNVTGVVGGIALTIGAIAFGCALKKLYNYAIKKRKERYLRNDNYVSYMSI